MPTKTICHQGRNTACGKRRHCSHDLGACQFARAFPDTTIILDHFSGPIGIGPYAGKAEGVSTRKTAQSPAFSMKKYEYLRSPGEMDRCSRLMTSLCFSVHAVSRAGLPDTCGSGRPAVHVTSTRIAPSTTCTG